MKGGKSVKFRTISPTLQRASFAVLPVRALAEQEN